MKICQSSVWSLGCGMAWFLHILLSCRIKFFAVCPIGHNKLLKRMHRSTMGAASQLQFVLSGTSVSRTLFLLMFLIGWQLQLWPIMFSWHRLWTWLRNKDGELCMLRTVIQKTMSEREKQWPKHMARVLNLCWEMPFFSPISSKVLLTCSFIQLRWAAVSVVVETPLCTVVLVDQFQLMHWLNSSYVQRILPSFRFHTMHWSFCTEDLSPLKITCHLFHLCFQHLQ